LTGERWDVFKKLVLVEKHISDIMCENPESLSLLALICRRPGYGVINILLHETRVSIKET